METNFLSGTYNVPTDNNLSASYVVPGMTSKEVVEKILAAENCEERKHPAYTSKDEETNNVTHSRYFGENISRAFKTLTGR